MSHIDNRIALFQKKIVPATTEALQQTIAFLYRTKNISVPVILSCMKLSYFFAILLYRWGMVAFRAHSEEIYGFAAQIALAFFSKRMEQTEQTFILHQALDDVTAGLVHAFRVETEPESYTALTVIEKALPVGSLIARVKKETDRAKKIDTWVHILEHTLSQVTLVPFAIASLMIARSTEEWAKLQDPKRAEKPDIFADNFEMSSEAYEVQQADVTPRIEKAMEPLTQPLASIIRHALIECTENGWKSPNVARVNFSASDISERSEALLKRKITLADIRVLVDSIRLSIDKFMPCFAVDIVAVGSTTGMQSLGAEAMKMESFVALRTYIIDSIFENDCLPFLEKCAQECASYDPETESAKLIHFCMMVSARLHRESQRWIHSYDFLYEFFTNITKA